MYFNSFAIGYIDIPNKTTLNIYTVGCPHNCPGCHTPDLQNFNHPKRLKLTVNEIEKKLYTITDFFQGVCWLGGDPLYQFDEFININQMLKMNNPNLLIAVYTGYEFEKMPIDKQLDLISCVDILIDGKWNGIPITDKNTNEKVWIKKNNTLIQISYENLKNNNY
jgi:anaerobic ribonucleoside-triphosphate reductase activating protein